MTENDLGTHDLHVTIRIPAHGQTKEQTLRFLILTPSTIASDKVEGTLSRVQRLSSLSGGKFCASIFHLSPFLPPPKPHGPRNASVPKSAFPTPVHAFNTLQIALHKSHINIPLLPLSAPSALPTLLTTFSRPFTQVAPLGPKLPNAAMDILPFCTTDAPTRQELLVKVSDVAGSLREVASLGLREDDAARLVEEGMGEEDVDGLLRFWEEEWVVE